MALRNLTYKAAGVDIDTGNQFVRMIKPLISSTKRPEALGSIGGFGGFFKPNLGKMREPVLVSATDGVGTKLMLARTRGKFDTIGIDLVAMCVNDVVVTGAEPLFFLDYFATGKISLKSSVAVMRGIVGGCKKAGCTLVGGETAELPGMYRSGEFDLAGFSVGLVDRKKIIDGRKVKAGDVILGLASSGLHSNGYSLARKVFRGVELRGRIGKILMKPTVIYVKPVLSLIKSLPINTLAHITGGGFYDNIPRVLPKHLTARIVLGSWPIPRIFDMIQERGSVTSYEMFRTFNMGIGMIVVIKSSNVTRAQRVLKRYGIASYKIGTVVRGKTLQFV